MKEKLSIGAFFTALILILIASIWWITSNSPSTSVKQMMQKEIKVPQLHSYIINKTDKFGNALGDGAVITRQIRELKGFIHYGVMYHGMVAHYNQYGYHLDSLKDFSKNETIKVLRKGLVGEDLTNFRKRFLKVTKMYNSTKYHAMKNNCEHFANELVFGVKKSSQAKFTNEMLKTYEPMIYEELNKSKFAIFTPGVKVAINNFINDSIK